MDNIIKNLFLEYGLMETPAEFGKIYYFDQQDRNSYWLVMVTDSLEFILEKQTDYFLTAKEITKNEWFDKNANLLVLFNTSALSSINKDEILAIEENPYLFKKQVLVYTTQEFENLRSAIVQSGKETRKFLQNKILSNTVFEKHKKSFDNNDYESLLYRIMHKIPFIAINVKQDTGLTALQDSNSEMIGNSTHIEFDKILNQAFFLKDADEIKEMSPEDIYNELVKALPTYEDQ